MIIHRAIQTKNLTTLYHRNFTFKKIAILSRRAILNLLNADSEQTLDLFNSFCYFTYRFISTRIQLDQQEWECPKVKKNKNETNTKKRISM